MACSNFLWQMTDKFSGRHDRSWLALTSQLLRNLFFSIQIQANEAKRQWIFIFLCSRCNRCTLFLLRLVHTLSGFTSQRFDPFKQGMPHLYQCSVPCSYACCICVFALSYKSNFPFVHNKDWSCAELITYTYIGCIPEPQP